VIRILIGLLGLCGVAVGLAFAHGAVGGDESAAPSSFAHGTTHSGSAPSESVGAVPASDANQLRRRLNRICVKARRDLAPLQASLASAASAAELVPLLDRLMPLNAEVNGRFARVSFPAGLQAYRRRLLRLFARDERGLRRLADAVRRGDLAGAASAESALTALAALEDGVFQRLGAVQCLSSEPA